MGYQALLKKTFKSGDFRITDAEAAEVDPQHGGTWQRVRREMEEIAERETGDANSCLTVHREGIMKLAPFVKFREEKFGAVLFETRSEKVFTLSPTGAAVVREVIAGADARTVVENLKVKYEDKTGRMEQEAAQFIACLKDRGLVTE